MLNTAMSSLKQKIYSYVIKGSKILSRKGLYEFLEQEYSKILEGESVITIGAGGGVNDLLKSYAQKQEFTLISFDIDEQRKPDIVGDLCAYDFGSRQFDVVIISEVLEHIPCPHLAIENLYKILKKNGRLVLTVPFMFPIHDRPYDYFRYTRYGLEFLLKSFQEVTIHERNSWAEAINVLAPRLVKENHRMARLAAPIVVFLAILNLPFVLLIGKMINTDFITTGYVVTAKK